MIEFNGNIGVEFRKLAQNKNSEVMIYGLDRNYSYSDVDVYSDAIAKKIVNKCKKRHIRVGLYLNHSPLVIISIIAVLKAGCSYVPISKKLMPNNKKIIVEEANVELIITDEPWKYTPTDSLDVEQCMSYTSSSKIEYRTYDNTSEVYVLFTSGSTGKPKGCSVNYGNLVYILSGLQKICPVSDTSVYMFSTPYNFDVSTSEIYGWINGGKILAIDLTLVENLKNFPQYVRMYHVSHYATSPSVFLNMLNNYSNQELESIASELKYVMIAGESFKRKIYEIWRERQWDFGLFNLYGPTEATVYATYYRFEKNPELQEIPIGTCIEGCKYEIINKDKDGKGELVLKGNGITDGYVNNAEECKKRFYKEKSTNCYCTGDIVAMHNGMLYFYGRNDDQVQIHGIRLELNEIENTLRDIEGVMDVAVVYNENLLVGNFVVKKGVTKVELLKYMNENIPKYMIPNYFEFVDELARTINNKIDRNIIWRRYKEKQNIEANKNEQNENKAVQDKIISIMKEALGNNEINIGYNSDFFESGGDSLSVVNLLVGIEREFDIECNIDMIYTARTPYKLSEYVLKSNENLATHKQNNSMEIQFVLNEVQRCNQKVFDFLINTNSSPEREYPCCHNQYIIYNNKINRCIAFSYSVSKQYKREDLNSKIVKLLIQNPILRSKILKRNEKLFFTEYAVSDKLEIPYLNLQSWNCKFDVVEDYFLEGFEKLITNLRYQNGFLALFVLLEDVENYHIVSVLDHCIADASSVSIIKKKISGLLNNKNDNTKYTYFDYCTFLKKNNSFLKILKSDYLQERMECMVCNVDDFISNIQDFNTTIVVNHVEAYSSIEISILISYLIGRMVLQCTSLKAVSIKTILNLREYDGFSFKDTLGDMHSNVSFLLHREMNFESFRKKAYDTIKIYTIDFIIFSYVHLYQDEPRYGEVKEILDRSGLFSINYLGDIMGKKKELFDNEIRKAQKELYDIEKKIFATAYRDNDKVYILVNKNISRLTNEVSSSEIENM